MRHFTDQVVFRTVRFLKGQPAAFRFFKRHLSNTVFHRMAQRATRNVDLHRAAQRAAGLGALSVGNGDPTEYWDGKVALVESKELKGWLDWEFIEVEHIRPQVSGDKSVYYLQHFFRTHLPAMPVERALSLGCGGGNLERALIQLNSARAIDAFDASPESIRIAAELAASEGKQSQIRYAVADINRLELPVAAYDFVVCKMSLHHFEDLDHVYRQIRRALKPGGVFMFNEFVGPSRFQWTDRQLELVNALLESLPERHRRSALTGERLTQISRPTVEEMIRLDPTEAVRSAEIVPSLAPYFEILERRDYGGTLLHLLLNHIMPTFDLEDPEQASLLRKIFLHERTLIEQKVITSDFAYVVARPR